MHESTKLWRLDSPASRRSGFWYSLTMRCEMRMLATRDFLEPGALTLPQLSVSIS